MKKSVFIAFFTLFSVVNFAQETTKSNHISNHSNTSISSSSTNKKFSYSAQFSNSEKDPEIQELIQTTLGTPTEQSKRFLIWEGKGYSVEFLTGKVSFELEIERTTKSVQLKLENLGEEISKILDSPKTPEPPQTK